MAVATYDDPAVFYDDNCFTYEGIVLCGGGPVIVEVFDTTPQPGTEYVAGLGFKHIHGPVRGPF